MVSHPLAHFDNLQFSVGISIFIIKVLQRCVWGLPAVRSIQHPGHCQQLPGQTSNSSTAKFQAFCDRFTDASAVRELLREHVQPRVAAVQLRQPHLPLPRPELPGSRRKHMSEDTSQTHIVE